MKGKVKKLLGIMIICLAFCGFVPAAGALAKDIVIMIDPGHGSSERGASRTWSGVEYREEVYNLKIARYLKAELETYSGVKVYMTHNSLEGDCLNREQRLKAAKRKKANALISIHNNSTNTKKTSKTGSYAVVPSLENYPDSLSCAKKSRELGRSILRELNASVGLKNNGYWFDDELGIILYGMKYKIPSIIVEHCFVNNPKDCKRYLGSEAQLRKIGMADAAAIAKYYKLEKAGAKPVKNGWITGKNGYKYYYVQGVRLKNGWKKIDGKYYYFNKTGVLKTGVFKIGNSLYLSDKNGVRQKGVVTYKGKKYYAGSKGKLYTGFRTIKGKKYYFGPKTGAMQKNCWVKPGGKWYYVGKNGIPYKNVKKKIKGKIYIFNKKGVCTNKI